MTVAELLEEHGVLTDELASAYRQLALLQEIRAQHWAASWRGSEGFGVTERRERALVHVADDDGQISRVQGERDALKVELAHIELVLAHAQPERSD